MLRSLFWEEGVGSDCVLGPRAEGDGGNMAEFNQDWSVNRFGSDNNN